MDDILTHFEKVLQELQDAYDSQIEQDMPHIELENQVLSDAIKNQITLQLIWEDLTNEVSFIVSELETECDKIFSVAFRDLSMDSHKALTFNEAKIFSQSDADYIVTKRVLNKAKSLYGRCKAVLDSIQSRKYLLKNLTDLLRDGNDSYII